MVIFMSFRVEAYVDSLGARVSKHLLEMLRKFSLCQLFEQFAFDFLPVEEVLVRDEFVRPEAVEFLFEILVFFFNARQHRVSELFKLLICQIVQLCQHYSQMLVQAGL